MMSQRAISASRSLGLPAKSSAKLCCSIGCDGADVNRLDLEAKGRRPPRQFLPAGAKADDAQAKPDQFLPQRIIEDAVGQGCSWQPDNVWSTSE